MNKSVYEVDSNAEAVILHERVIYSVKRIAYGLANIRVKVRQVVKILSKDATNKGNITIPTPFKISEFLSATGTTYNIEDDKVVSQQFDKKNFKIETLGMTLVGKLSLPGVKVGSVIDYEYDVDNNISYASFAWNFQATEPKLYSEVQVIYPENATLIYVAKSDKEFVFFNNENPVLGKTELPEAYRFDSKTESITTSKTWVRRLVPALDAEPFVTNFDNYSEQIEFMFSYRKNIFNSWDTLNSNLYYNPGYFGTLSQKDAFLRRCVDSLTANCITDQQRIYTIYSYVRDSFKGYFSDDIGPCCKLPEVWKSKKGSLSDINSLLVKLFREAGFKSNPVLISTTNHRRVPPNVPLVNRFNFVACRVEVGDDVLYLDAHEKTNAFGHLPFFCYNGMAWVVDSTGYAVNLLPASIRDRYVIQVITESEKIEDYRIVIKETFGKISSQLYRVNQNKDSLAIKNYILQNLKKFPFETELLNYEVLNEKNVDTTLAIRYTAKINWNIEDQMILVPAIYGAYSENPFKSTKRTLPVEFPYAKDFYCSINLKIPENFTAAELPKSKVVKLSEEDQYNYYISFYPETNSLVLNTKLHLRNTVFEVDRYPYLRAFFSDIIQLQQQACLITKKL
ncbi:MAG TPA: DUF3857 domain-containing protein [Flavipsychrobacter sp.]|nr:DUF3857 domain-containing protein [Flavipsychrobacter sp.]